MPDFSTYQPPGVYIEEDLSSLVSVIGVRPTVVALVGPSVGYRVNTEAIILSGTDPVELSRKGINTSTIEVKGADGTAYTLTTDYTVTVAAGEDGDIAQTADNTTTITRVGAGAIADGDIVYVSYRYTDGDYYAPLRARDFDDVQDAFGPPIDIENGSITSPISFAAKVAFENGATELVLVSTTGTATATTRAELSTAYNKLATLYDVNVVVPLAVGITGNQAAPGDTYGVGSDLKGHVEAMSLDGLFRVGIVGFEASATIDPATAAANFRSSRVVLAWPNRLHYFHGYTNTTIEVGGYYLAAAYAGRLASIPVQMPLTHKQVFGFAGFPASLAQTMTKTTKNTWSDQGVAVTEVSRDGRLVVRHGTTTQRTNIQTRELSLVRAKDALINLLQETVDSSELVGTWIDEETPGRVKGVVAGVLETAKQNRVIVDYMGLKIRQLPGDPSVLEVKFQYQPAYPLNYIVVSFSINTSTGETTVLDLAA